MSEAAKAGVSPAKPQLVSCVAVNLGCDPELFIEGADGKVIGSELVIPKEGVDSYYSSGCKIVRDGVQVELNPRPYSCRESLASEVRLAIQTLSKQLGEGRKINFSSVVELDPEELAKLSEESRRLGCAPSINRYDKKSSIKCDPATYTKRSAGGHVHLGIYREYMGHPDALSDLLDLGLGNTCVMIDRDPNAAERRKVYGRAGEYRLPKHGFEYRTLSNFWLRSYPLFSLVMGLSRQMVQIYWHQFYGSTNYTPGGWKPYDELMSHVDRERVREAINTNNLELAKENWQVFKQFLIDHVDGMTGLCGRDVVPFEYFCSKIESDGIGYWFPKDPLSHWNSPEANIGQGWERFIRDKVPAHMAQERLVSTGEGLRA